ncbi:MAG TPA: hypothetical protein EYP85_07705 [Armatimonadetes bacterium]|nr:hypothetical protein [Armatimonadota bacterium]
MAKYHFRGFEAIQSLKIKVRYSQCRRKDCENNCTLNIVTLSGPGLEVSERYITGDRCGRYSAKIRVSDRPDLFQQREEIMFECAGEPLTEGPTVGIARTMLFNSLYPWWATFFRELGLRVVLSHPTSKQTIEEGNRAVGADMCFPIKTAYGHFKQLQEMVLEDGRFLDFIFIPQVINLPFLKGAEAWRESFTCPYIQTIFELVRDAVDLGRNGTRVLTPEMHYREGPRRLAWDLRKLAPQLGVFLRDIQRAVEAAHEAQETFRRRLREAGEEVLSSLPEDEEAWVFLMRPYVMDKEVNMGMAQKCLQKGILPIPLDYLPLDATGMPERYYNMYSAMGQQFLAAINTVQKDPRLSKILRFAFPDYFHCGPNSMILHYLRCELGTNFLYLYLDEHMADAGLLTRMSAFSNTAKQKKTKQQREEVWRPFTLDKLRTKRFLIPPMSIHAHLLRANLEGEGIEALVMEPCPDPHFEIAREKCNGNECLPHLMNIADALYNLQLGRFDPQRDVLFQGGAGGPCRYGLYAPTQAIILQEEGIRIGIIDTRTAYKVLGKPFLVKAFDSFVFGDVLLKMLHCIRPYERNAGEAQAVFNKYLELGLEYFRTHHFSMSEILQGRNLWELEEMIRAAAQEFARIELTGEAKPIIVLIGEFYVREDARANQFIIDKIEHYGGQVCKSPASELFVYTNYRIFLDSWERVRFQPSLPHLLASGGFWLLNTLAKRDEHRLEQAASLITRGLEEPAPEEIKRLGQQLFAHHYGGEPIMSLGRALHFALKGKAQAIANVVPFTCMPGSTVAAQSIPFRQKFKPIPFHTFQYDGYNDPNREKRIELMVHQAREIMEEGLE